MTETPHTDGDTAGRVVTDPHLDPYQNDTPAASAVDESVPAEDAVPVVPEPLDR